MSLGPAKANGKPKEPSVFAGQGESRTPHDADAPHYRLMGRRIRIDDAD